MARNAVGPERVWQDNVEALLRKHGYVVDHSYQLLTRDGIWRTGSTWIGKPDLVALRPPRVLAIEVKAKGRKGTAGPRQLASLSWWSMVPCARAWLLLPDSVPYDTLVDWIRRPAQAPATFGFEPMGQLEAFRVLATADQRTAR